MKNKLRVVKIGSMSIQFDSEVYQGSLMDTIVSINGIDIMTIEGESIEDVIKVFRCLNDYRI
jgi:hypothetical protein